MFFPGFTLETVDVRDGSIRVRHGGSGLPILLLHGHPRTHTTWWRVAPLLADAGFSVVCPDVPGFGRSYKPPTIEGSSKRAKARVMVELMDSLGFEQFAIVGHDRGAGLAFRLAMDHPEHVANATIIDGVPTIEALERCGEEFARKWWHWFFYAQPEKPERAILADPDAWYGGSPQAMGEENYCDFREAIHDPLVVKGMLDDYRAGLNVDPGIDAEDRSRGRKLEMPTQILWTLQDDMETLYGDVLGVWRTWVAGPLSGQGIDCGHHVAEEAPEELVASIRTFMRDFKP